MSVAFQIDRLEKLQTEVRVLAAPYTLPHSSGYIGRTIVLICPPGISPAISTATADSMNGGAFTVYRFASSYSGQASWLQFTSAFSSTTGNSSWWMTGSGWTQELITSFPIGLPAVAEAESRTFRCKNTSAVATATITTNGAETILDTGATSLVLAPLGYVELYSDGTQWLVVG